MAKAPDTIFASKTLGGGDSADAAAVPYPEHARWKGQGSTNEASNFACKT